jgi:hypothetical protein
MTKLQKKTLTMHYLVSKTLRSVPMNSPMKTPPKAAITQMHLPKDGLSQNQLFASSDDKASTSKSDHIDNIYHANEYPAKEYPNTTPSKSNYKNQDSSNSNHTSDISTSNDLNVLPKIQVSNSTYAVAYPNTNAKFSTNAICSSSAPVSTTYVQQFCFLPFNPHFPFPVLSDMPDFSLVFPQNIPLSHLYLFNLFPDHPS